jgi:hypothetical protein
MAHKFNVGQIVELEPRLRRLSDPGRLVLGGRLHRDVAGIL